MSRRKAKASTSHRRARSVLDELVAPIPLRTFLREYFCRQPLHVPGRPRKFAFIEDRLPNGRALAGATNVRAIFDELRQARIDPGDADDMFRSGATICATGLEHSHPALLELTQRARTDLRFSGSVSLRGYWSPAGSGFDLHYDPRIVMTLQLRGRKQWWFSSTTPAEFPLTNAPAMSAARKRKLAETQGMQTCVLGPGDLLCLPPGTWHRARAHEPCFAVNLAFDYLDAGAADVVLAAVRDELLRRPDLRAPLFNGREHALGVGNQAALETVCIAAQEILARLLASSDELRRIARKTARFGSAGAD